MAAMAEEIVPFTYNNNPGKPTFIAEYGTGKFYISHLIKVAQRLGQCGARKWAVGE